MATSSFVFIEPAPYDIAMLFMLVWFFVLGLRFPTAIVALVACLGLFMFSGLVGATQSLMVTKSALYIGKTTYLSGAAAFFACYVAAAPERAIPLIMSGYVIAALIAAICAIAGYFELIPGAHDLFTIAQRASGTFKDPNVYAPFLIPPALYALTRVFRANPVVAVIWGAAATVMAAGLFLSFSRGAWAGFLLSSAMTVFLVMGTTKQPHIHARIVITMVLAIAAASFVMLLLLADKGASQLFAERFSLTQSYDTADSGRFAGQLAAINFILHRPLGLGATEFARIWGLEPHNIYIKSFLTGGWLGGFTYLAMVLVTIWVGFSNILRATPELSDAAIVIFTSFLVIALEGAIIDTNHWRHFYLLMGMIWGIHAGLKRMSLATQPHGFFRWPGPPLARLSGKHRPRSTPFKSGQMTRPMAKISNCDPGSS